MTDLPDDEPQPGSRAWMEQTAQLDSAMATARRYLSALNAQDHRCGSSSADPRSIRCFGGRRGPEHGVQQGATRHLDRLDRSLD